MIFISKAAAAEIKRLQSSRNQTNTSLYLSVKEGGCFDLLYNLQLVEADNIQSPVEHLEASHGINIITDGSSRDYLQGLKLDYSEDLMGGGFRFYNPQALKHCSCGLSFHPKTEAK